MVQENYTPEIVTTPRNGGTARRPGEPRIAMYSHDAQGLGHIRRNLLISRALCRGGAAPVILLLSGVREASAFAMPAGVDCLTLPALGKGRNGDYFPRSLDMPMGDLMRIRSDTILAALESFDPDVFIVDKLPRGVFHELVAGIDALRRRGRARLVLGLRDVLDEPEAVRRDWDRDDVVDAVRADFDQIWVYGDPMVYDAARMYDMPDDLAARVRYTGYLNPRDGLQASSFTPEIAPTLGERFLCLVGGGRDGLPLAQAFLAADLPGESVLVTGPLMPRDARARLHAVATERRDCHVLEFITNPCPLLETADHVIAMGGYNTMCELLAFNKRALIVPRTEPRQEQLIRAERFAELGLVDMLRPEHLTSRAIERWGRRSTAKTPVGEVIDFTGVERLPCILDTLLSSDRFLPGVRPMPEDTHV